MRVIIFILCLLIVSLPVSAAENMKVWTPYLQNIEKKIKASWYEETALDRHTKQGATNVVFTILNDGSLEEVRVIMSNCDEQMQQRAVSVVKKNAPFPPFPKEVASTQGVNVNYIFNYVLLPENKKESNNQQAQSVLNAQNKYIDNTAKPPAQKVSQSDNTAKNDNSQPVVSSTPIQEKKRDVRGFLLKCILSILLLQSMAAFLLVLYYQRKQKTFDEANSQEAKEYFVQACRKEFRKVFLISMGIFTLILIIAIAIFIQV